MTTASTSRGETLGTVHGGGRVPTMLCNNRGMSRFAVAGSDIHGLICDPRVFIIRLAVSNGGAVTVIGSVRFRPMASTVLRVSFLRISRGGPMMVRIPIILRNRTRNIGTNNGLGLRVEGLGMGTLCATVPRGLFVGISRLKLNGAVRINTLRFRNLRLVGTGGTIIYTIRLAHTTHNTRTGTWWGCCSWVVWKRGVRRDVLPFIVCWGAAWR